jgi:adenosylcobinamide-GDP ribazoletransferase
MSLTMTLRHELRLFLTAIQYFTRVPVPDWVGHNAAQLNAAARYFPLVGVAVGGVGALTLFTLSHALPLWTAVVISTVITLLLTGAFHEDGLADTFDGLGAMANRERALEIMKDSRLGSFGVLALTMVLLLKVSALAEMPVETAALGLIAGHAVSRWCAVIVIWRMQYVRDDESSKAKPLVHELSLVSLTVASLSGLLPLALIGEPAIVGIACAIGALLIVSRWFYRRLRGYTGDALGATQQITEVVFYVGLVGAIAGS